MSRVLKESREEAIEMFKLGVISQKKYEKMMSITAKDINIPKPNRYDGKKISRIRENLHCSQKIFADIVGVTAGTVSKWERGTGRPDKKASRFIRVLDRQGLGVLD